MIIDVATANIIAAQESLEFKSGDIRAYEATLAKVKQADYSTVSWKEYQKAVTANVVTAENKQTEIDQATKTSRPPKLPWLKKAIYPVTILLWPGWTKPIIRPRPGRRLSVGGQSQCPNR